jgi:predicted nuclease of restriction endonuclease-like RecB superfamily
MKFEGTWKGTGVVLVRDGTTTPTSVTSVNKNYMVEIQRFTKKCYLVKITEDETVIYYSSVFTAEDNKLEGEFAVQNGFGNLILVLKSDKKAKLFFSTAASSESGIINTAGTVKLCRLCIC